MIQTEVRDPLTDEILFGRLEGGGTVTIALKDGKLDFRFEAVGAAERHRSKPPDMSDQDEQDIPVKVVDRRWWANPEPRRAPPTAATTSLKPTYVEELEQKVAEKDKQIQEYITKYRQAASEFEEMRLRLRREISKDIERDATRDPLRAPRSRRQSRARPRGGAPRRRRPDALLQGVEMVRRQFLEQARRARREADRLDRHPLRSRCSTKPSAPCPPRRPNRTAWSSASSARAIASATTCCGPACGGRREELVTRIASRVQRTGNLAHHFGSLGRTMRTP